MNVGWVLLVSQLAWSGSVGEIKIGPDSVKFAFPSTYDSLAKSLERRKLSYDTLVDDFDRDGTLDRFVRVYDENSTSPDEGVMEGWALYTASKSGATELVWARSIDPGCTYPSGCSRTWSATRGCLFWGWSGGSMAGSTSFVDQYRFRNGDFQKIGSVHVREDTDESGSLAQTTRTDWNLITGRQIEEIREWGVDDDQEQVLRKKSKSTRNVKPKGGRLPVLGESESVN